MADAANPAVKVLSLWQPAEGTGIDGKTCRGMVGQIYFFTRKSPIGAKVDGTVRIYLFDDQGSDEDQVKPLHQFDFPADSWAARGQDGELGHAYSVFIPYTRKGFHEAHCGLRIRFTPAAGGFPVYSEMTYVTLPGSRKRSAKPESQAQAAEATEEQLEQVANARRAETTVAGLLEVATAAKAKASKPRIELSQAERDRIIRETREKLSREAQDTNSRLMNAEQIEIDIDEDETGLVEPGAGPIPQGRTDSYNRYDRYDRGDFRKEAEEGRFGAAASPQDRRFSQKESRELGSDEERRPSRQRRLPASHGPADGQAGTPRPAATPQIACVANGRDDRAR
jgi:hypothetical protein